MRLAAGRARGVGVVPGADVPPRHDVRRDRCSRRLECSELGLRLRPALLGNRGIGQGVATMTYFRSDHGCT